VYGCGTTTGFDVEDKFSRFGLTRHQAEKIKAPMVKEAVAHLECRVCQIVDMGASSLIIGQILAAAADPRHFQNSKWNFDNGLQLIHHLGGNRFGVSSQAVTAKKI
jgi:flavin reductase (DIM6/NTAB) family NADH-FMN oxidoreductase RutF